MAAREIAERMREVIASGLVKNASQWSADAGLARQHVSTYMTRVDAGEEPDIGTKTLVELARVARVNFLWLATGEGDRAKVPESLDLSDLPAALAEVLSDEDEEGRTEPWLPITLDQLRSFAKYGGHGDMAAWQWRDLGDRYDRANRRVLKGLPESKVAPREKANVADDLEEAFDAERAKVRPKKKTS